MSDYHEVTPWGTPRHQGDPAEIAAMFHPGRCRWCGSIYDGGTVEVTARYADCSVWKSPCCGNTADDRPVSWGGSFTPLAPEEREMHRRAARRMRPTGGDSDG